MDSCYWRLVINFDGLKSLKHLPHGEHLRKLALSQECPRWGKLSGQHAAGGPPSGLMVTAA